LPHRNRASHVPLALRPSRRWASAAPCSCSTCRRRCVAIARVGYCARRSPLASRDHARQARSVPRRSRSSARAERDLSPTKSVGVPGMGCRQRNPLECQAWVSVHRSHSAHLPGPQCTARAPLRPSPSLAAGRVPCSISLYPPSAYARHAPLVPPLQLDADPNACRSLRTCAQ
jgi:hypothetical protein